MNSTTSANTPENPLGGSANGINGVKWSPPSNAPSQTPLIGSCIHCRRRKVRCDKQSPCGNCVRFGTECELAPRKRAPRRPRKPVDGGEYTGRELELMKRLNSLEGIVKELSSHVDTNDSSPAKSADPIENGEDVHIRAVGRSQTAPSGLRIPESGDVVPVEKSMGTLMLSDEGKTRYVQRNFFSRLTDEVDDLVQLFFDGDREEDEDISSPETSSASNDRDHQSFVFGYASTQLNMRDLHPLPSQLPYYVQIYAEKVDLLVKILHMPTVEALFKDAQNDLNSLSRSSEALIFAIYFAVITSMSVEEVKSNLGFERKAIYDKYRFGTEQALARANFLDTSDLTTLQAFVLYLATVRCEDHTRVPWALMRSAVGVAQSMGLHRDGNVFHLSPYDVEMRRRLWWQLCILDFRLSEKDGSETCTMDISFDTQRPLNINDSDLLPDALVAPEPRVGLTDLSIALITCEISSAAHKLLSYRSDDGVAQVSGKEERIRKFCQVLEERYVKHCTDLTPISWMVSRLCKLVICKLESMLLLPLTRTESTNRDPESKELYDKMFLASIEGVELRRDLEADITKQWHWYLRTIIQWHAIAYLLSELCVREPDDNVTRAWNVLDLVFQDYREIQGHGAPGMLMAPMKKLIARARQKRAQDLEKLRAAEITAQTNGQLDNTAATQIPDIPPAQDFFPGTFDFQNVSTPQGQTYGDYQQDWLQQQQQQYPTMAPTPWLLEDSALQDLGIDMNYLDPNMEWEGLNDLMSQMEPAYGSNSHGPFGGW
ncbi:hypothetical protein ONS95_001367 [Cadophora gregata]|uniref:uncharacterized protein n=1 Tax=Cadophora gregata TaxID=51156 RepID=UPI0026DD5884|nr:uncharacterized protein ONS95_001367 [Cadophora gregata]KAK0110986.1 hypothetical protein ONS95_001367 [Cadophora gregata]KAK0112555.1 hypothetical protein ONS96_001790 [Cadophora gregata f. sp. sojae]